MKIKLMAAVVAGAALLLTVGGLVLLSVEDDGKSMVVYRSPTCGCCQKWADYMADHGYDVEVRNVSNLSPIKRELGVPLGVSSCHTAVVDGYVIEGHVPASTVARMLREQPEIVGITVPGMPIGSPGMEGPNPVPYDVLAIDKEGASEQYERIPVTP